jgi:hypothetical protein
VEECLPDLHKTLGLIHSTTKKKKKKEVITHAIMWMNFENIMLREIRHSQKDRCCMILHEVSSQIHRDRK